MTVILLKQLEIFHIRFQTLIIHSTTRLCAEGGTLVTILLQRIQSLQNCSVTPPDRTGIRSSIPPMPPLTMLNPHLITAALDFSRRFSYNNKRSANAGPHMETYRSGHNGADSKSVCLNGHVGSNPTVSAKRKNPSLVGGFFRFSGDARDMRIL